MWQSLNASVFTGARVGDPQAWSESYFKGFLTITWQKARRQAPPLPHASYATAVGGDGASFWSLFENNDLTFQKKGAPYQNPFWQRKLWLAFILARSTDTSGTTAFTLRQLNRARPARFDNRAGSRLHWSYVTVLELLTRRRSLTQTNHAVEQWRARGPAKKLCTASSCLFSVYSIVAFF